MVVSGRQRGSSGEWEKPFWQQRGWQISAAFLIAMALIGGVALLSGGGDDSGAPAAKPSAVQSSADGGETSAPSQATGEGRPAGCRTDDSDQDTRPKPPADVQWRQLNSTLVPVSETAGPVKFDGPAWSCFAHTPMGAVLAAHVIPNQFDDSNWRDVVDRQMPPGAARDAYIRKRSKLPDDSVVKAPPGSRGTYAAYSIVSYSEEQATVMVVMQIPRGGYGAGTVTVVWDDGDWKLRPTLSGSLLETATPVGGLEGFTEWGTPDAS
ncbi:hypothetical protein [Streptomyces sp. NPDC006610]|jgi:hypothetical protein|uniref:hypothetical protein n=1 Tax=Streptomyces sp. NPDC006610 TaxID=3154584 RepID=UPI0033A4B727